MKIVGFDVATFIGLYKFLSIFCINDLYLITYKLIVVGNKRFTF